MYVYLLYPTEEWGVAWDLREMGSTPGGENEGGPCPPDREQDKQGRSQEQHGARGRGEEESGVTKRTHRAQSEHSFNDPCCAGSCEPGSRCRPNECIFGSEKLRGVGILE